MPGQAKTEIKKFIISQFAPEVTPDQLDDDYELIETGLIDSLKLLRVISWLATTYEIPTNEISVNPDDFRTVSSISRIVDQARSAAGIN